LEIAPWQTKAWRAEMRRSLRPNAYLRMIENRFVTTESTFATLASVLAQTWLRKTALQARLDRIFARKTGFVTLDLLRQRIAAGARSTRNPTAH
jgi:hypothetical protein